MESTPKTPDADTEIPTGQQVASVSREGSGLGLLTSPQRKLERPRASGRRAEFSPPRRSPPTSNGSGSGRIYNSIIAQASPLLKAAADTKREPDQLVENTEEAPGPIPYEPSASATSMPEVPPVLQQGNAETDKLAEKHIPDEEMRAKYGPLLAQKEYLQKEQKELGNKMDILEREYETQREQLEKYPEKLSQVEDIVAQTKQEVVLIAGTANFLYDSYLDIKQNLEALKRRNADFERSNNVCLQEAAAARKTEQEALDKYHSKDEEMANLLKMLEESKTENMRLKSQLQASKKQYEGLRKDLEGCRRWLDKARTEQLRKDRDQLQFCDNWLMDLLPKKQPFRHLSTSSATQYQTLEDYINSSPMGTVPPSIKSLANTPRSATVRHLPPRNRASTGPMLSNMRFSLPQSPRHPVPSPARPLQPAALDNSVPASSQAQVESAASSPQLPYWVTEGNGENASPRPSRMSLDLADLQKQINISGLVFSGSPSNRLSLPRSLDSPSRPAPLRIRTAAGQGQEEEGISSAGAVREDNGSQRSPGQTGSRDEVEPAVNRQSPPGRSAEPAEGGDGGSDDAADLESQSRLETLSPISLTSMNIPGSNNKDEEPDAEIESIRTPATAGDLSDVSEESHAQSLQIASSGRNTPAPSPGSNSVSQDLVSSEELLPPPRTSNPETAIQRRSSSSLSNPRYLKADNNTTSSSTSNMRLLNGSRRTSMSERPRVAARNLAPIKTIPQALQSSIPTKVSPLRTPVRLLGSADEAPISRTTSLSPRLVKVDDTAATSSAIGYPQTPGLRRRAPMSPLNASYQPPHLQLSTPFEERLQANVMSTPSPPQPFAGLRTPEINAESSEDVSPGTTIVGSDYSDNGGSGHACCFPDDEGAGTLRSISLSPTLSPRPGEAFQVHHTDGRPRDVSSDDDFAAQRHPVMEPIDDVCGGTIILAENYGTTPGFISKGVSALRRLPVDPRMSPSLSSGTLEVVMTPIVSTMASLASAIASIGRNSDSPLNRSHSPARGSGSGSGSGRESESEPEIGSESELETEDDYKTPVPTSPQRSDRTETADSTSRLGPRTMHRENSSSGPFSQGQNISSQSKTAREGKSYSTWPSPLGAKWKQWAQQYKISSSFGRLSRITSTTPTPTPTSTSTVTPSSQSPSTRRRRHLFIVILVAYVTMALFVLKYGPMATFYSSTSTNPTTARIPRHTMESSLNRQDSMMSTYPSDQTQAHEAALTEMDASTLTLTLTEIPRPVEPCTPVPKKTRFAHDHTHPKSAGGTAHSSPANHLDELCTLTPLHASTSCVIPNEMPDLESRSDSEAGSESHCDHAQVSDNIQSIYSWVIKSITDLSRRYSTRTSESRSRTSVFTLVPKADPKEALSKQDTGTGDTSKTVSPPTTRLVSLTPLSPQDAASMPLFSYQNQSLLEMQQKEREKQKKNRKQKQNPSQTLWTKILNQPQNPDQVESYHDHRQDNTKSHHNHYTPAKDSNRNDHFSHSQYQYQYQSQRRSSRSVGPAYWGFVPGLERRLDMFKLDLLNWLMGEE
ncbi:hypothetical protein A1O1_01943 [Capronia coronata CBS 617.96]|uniref:Uncharacterized protein n=1 Tax=Capronia coronata CBS 617.96 TaxID=1182541 RepID=W9YWA2_9EURO|nr:uncharacterized protein A1O1_01943 [Capronia coronata CBS 617.96]EXJ93551.1 hypothetical protein A1O1_01943 [Capronia coronata CBS 617.96]